MAIIAEKNSQPRTLAPQGNHVARCYSMVHVGTIESEYMGEKKMLNKVRLTWELPNEQHVFNEETGEQPFVVSNEYTLSMGEKSNLRKHLESWRGKVFTEEEASSFDVTKLLGVPCMLNVVHKVSKAGNEYVTIGSISPMPKGMECPPQINTTFEFNFDNCFDRLDLLPDWIKDQVKSSLEFKSKTSGNETPAKQDDEDDDLPF